VCEMAVGVLGLVIVSGRSEIRDEIGLFSGIHKEKSCHNYFLCQ
jgi:translation initiation factor 2 gamma subunit (eIF-2gamma)